MDLQNSIIQKHTKSLFPMFPYYRLLQITCNKMSVLTINKASIYVFQWEQQSVVAASMYFNITSYHKSIASKAANTFMIN